MFNVVCERHAKGIRMRTLSRYRFTLTLLVLAIAVLTGAAHTQTYSVIYNFSPGTKSGDPANPQYSGIIAQGHDGNLYSTTPAGGTLCGFCGVVFKMTPSGTLSHVFDFDYHSNGAPFTPFSGLTLGTDGNFYGTTEAGGNFSIGTVFKISASGNLTKLYDFGTCKSPCKEGGYPTAPPVEGRDGNFYGTTPHSTDGTDNGIVYKVTPSGKYTPIYAFDGISGGNPQDPLTLGTDGNFYGTTAKGGKTFQPCWGSSPTCGTVFRITPGGRVTFLYKFDQTHGAGPLGPLVQASDGNFYGTTSAGGNASGDGTIFKITLQGKFTLLYALNGSVDGKQPSAGLAQVTDGKGNTVALYGATQAGGSKGYGTLFKVSLSGAFTRLYDFDSATGRTPEITLMQDTTGILYGETFQGGTDDAGVFYSLNETKKLPPFVSLVSTSGKVGAPVDILGQGLNGTTGVSFNGKAAHFKIVSDTYLTATVPGLASTGSVTVKTPSGTLTSNHVFVVTPFITSFSPTSGKVRTKVVISGTTFTGATKVTFGGVAATMFNVDSDTQVTANVPTGAVTGKIAITTPSGTAVSAGIFTVTQ
jgi:uncharacterized repeat protein (TIGR03803 family)